MRVPVRRWDALPITWRQGEHVTIIAPTDGGKSTLMAALVAMRRWAVVVATKPEDATLRRQYVRHGFHVARSWPPPESAERVLLWPRYRSPADRDHQRQILRDALDAIFAEGGWTVALDELHHLADSLGLADVLTDYWRMGRSNGLSVLAATQRPAHVPLDAYSQARHLFLGNTSDDRDQRRLGEISGPVDRDTIRAVLPRLPRFAFLYVDARTGRMAITRAPARPRMTTREEVTA